MTYRCLTCGEVHNDLPHMGLDYPDYYFSLAEEERASRIELTSDTCIIDNENFFIRGVIEIPVHDHSQVFGFGVWVSQKKENFYTYLENFDSDRIGPFFGWLSNSIAYYSEDTISLQTMAHFRSDGLRPWIELDSTDHPLAVDQREGISLAEAWEIVHFYSI